MAGELEAMVWEMFEGVDRKDFDAVFRVIDDDVQGVDEISRRWLRGRDEVAAHWHQGLMPVEDIRTELRDVSEATLGEVGVLTCWIEQDYTLDGNAQHISGPTTILFRRRGNGWKMVLFHSIPLPEDEAQ